jgi:hypothetical protein
MLPSRHFWDLTQPAIPAQLKAPMRSPGVRTRLSAVVIERRPRKRSGLPFEGT